MAISFHGTIIYGRALAIWLSSSGFTVVDCWEAVLRDISTEVEDWGASEEDEGETTDWPVLRLHPLSNTQRGSAQSKVEEWIIISSQAAFILEEKHTVAYELMG